MDGLKPVPFVMRTSVVPLEQLLDAALLQPGAVFLAGYSGVRGEPLAKVFDQFVDGGGLALFEAGFE